jgi:hypothetical protein
MVVGDRVAVAQNSAMFLGCYMNRLVALDQSGGGVHGMVMMVVQRLDPPQ